MIHKILPIATFGTLVAAIVLTSCDSAGNSYSGHGTLQLAVGDLDSTNCVYANVNADKEADGTYSSPIYIGSSTYPEFELTHYVRSGLFYGGLTATNMTDSTTLSVDNYSCAVGHGAAGNNTYFVGDLSRVCAVTFHTDLYYSVALTPQFVMVTNAAYTYLCMSEGSDEYPAFTDNNYLTLHIQALNKQGGETGREVTYDLASRSSFVRNWTRVDLTSLGECYGLAFSLETNGDTPQRFCFDYLTANYSFSVDY